MALQSACASGAIALWRRDAPRRHRALTKLCKANVALMYSMRQGRPNASGMTTCHPSSRSVAVSGPRRPRAASSQLLR
eukprot:6358646-Prymnesium_polylepis.1